jgi:phytoene/squalene synthetase
VLLALTDAQRTYQIPIGLLDQLAYGTAADLDYGQPEPSARAQLAARYQTFEELRQYCYGVASVVGLVCIKIFGYRDPAAEPLAERCGLAFSAYEYYSRRQRRHCRGPSLFSAGGHGAVWSCGRRSGRATC